MLVFCSRHVFWGVSMTMLHTYVAAMRPLDPSQTKPCLFLFKRYTVSPSVHDNYTRLTVFRFHFLVLIVTLCEQAIRAPCWGGFLSQTHYLSSTRLQQSEPIGRKQTWTESFIGSLSQSEVLILWLDSDSTALQASFFSFFKHVLKLRQYTAVFDRYTKMFWCQKSRVSTLTSLI